MGVGHIGPEAQSGGTIGLLEVGDIITVCSERQELSVAVSEEEFAERRKNWVAPPMVKRGVLGKYAHNVSCASIGAVTDDF